MSFREKITKRCLIVPTIILCLIIPSSVFAGGALDTVKGYVDRVLEVLRDPSLKVASEKKIKKDKLWAISDQMFDFAELSRRTLAQNWSKFSPEQQTEFVGLFKKLLADTYNDKILQYTDEKIVFSKEVQLTDKAVEVQSTILTKTAEVPIYYRATLKADGWKVYDVVIEGVSLINNYRNQFREILANKPPASLLDTLRKKVDKA